MRLIGIILFTVVIAPSVIAATAAPEHWELKGCHKFGYIKSALRNQGVATDDHGSFWFSSTQGLLRTTSKYGDAHKLVLWPIPHSLSKLGDNHVGDIDVVGDKLFVSIEDGPKYLNPHVGIYNAKTLRFEKAFTLPVALQNDGVPWVAADAENVYSSEFARPNIINVYRQSDMTAIAPIRLSQALPRVQGAKIFNGAIYITADGEGQDIKGVYRADLKTGDVTLVATIPSEITELEGLAFAPTKGGFELDVLGNMPGSLRDALDNTSQEQLPRKLDLRKSELCTYNLE